MKIYEALYQLLSFQKSASLSEIAGVSGKKKIDVLKCLNTNEHLITKVQRGQQMYVTGFKDVVAEQLSAAYNRGLTYVISQADYGTKEIIECNNPDASNLQQSVVFGCYGDSHMAQVILNTPDNINALREMGIVPYKHYKCKSVREMWYEF